MGSVLKLLAMIGVVALSALMLMYVVGILSITALLVNTKVMLASFAVVAVASMAIAQLSRAGVDGTTAVKVDDTRAS